MMLNGPALEATEDVRYAKLLGAILGGKDGREYLEYLIDAAWWADPQQAEIVKVQLAAAQAAQGLTGTNPKDEKPEHEPGELAQTYSMTEWDKWLNRTK
jgi:hypothetical protein